MRIGTREIGHDQPPFIIAEAAFNHCGSLQRALEMIDVAKQAGCDAVKFQTYKTHEFCRPDDPMWPDFKLGELPDEAWYFLKERCDQNGIIFLSTPQNPSDLDLLLKVGIPAIKIGSDDLRNLDMLRYCARDDVGLPLILSCGMSTLPEAIEAVCAVSPADVAMLVCASQYPCPPEEVNLARITTLRQTLRGVPIGFSDHTGSWVAATAAAVLGACIFETHFMLDGVECVDKDFAFTPLHLNTWVHCIRSVHVALGDGRLELSAREAEQRKKFQREPGKQIRGVV